MVVEETQFNDYPKIWTLDEGTKVTVRPMVQHDRERLALFFKRIADEDLRCLKDDVIDMRVIERWIYNIDYGRVLPLVVAVNSRIIADASLHRRKEGLRRHLGGVRVVVAPEFRHKGLASKLIDELTDIARKEGLERLYAKIPADNQAAIEVFQARGFTQVARFDRNILDLAGKYHDLALFHLELAQKG